MKGFTSRVILFSMILAVCLVPLYAHHGTQFLTQAMQTSTTEVQLAELASNKSQDPRVKEFAQMLVRDHNQELEKMKQLRSARMGRSEDVIVTAKQQQTINRLSTLTGESFDREFIDVMVRSHRDSIRAFEAQTKVHGNAPDVSKKQTGRDTAQSTTREKPAATDHKYSRADMQQDLDTADFARATLPTLRSHLERAQIIHRELQGR